jgi:hypothetical protein
MKLPLESLRPRAGALTGVALVVAMYGFARPPTLSTPERTDIVSRFRFARQPMPEAPHGPYKSIRSVHPSLQRISAWMSSVGAAVALSDLDADGLSNDLCRVEPRTDQVIVAPAPGTGERYSPFALDPAPLSYSADTMAPMGCLAADLNEDGLIDLLVYYWGRTPIAFLRSVGTPGVKAPIHASDFVPTDIVPTGERWYTNAAFVADLDGDGHLDLVIGNYFKDGSRTLDRSATGTESMHDKKSKSFNGGSKRVLRWKASQSAPHPSVTFEDVPDLFDPQVMHGWTLAAGAADLDGDLLPEIYFANDFGPDRLLHNRSTPGHLKFVVVEGVRRFTTPASCVLGHDSFKGMGVDFADVNGDGVPDIYVSNIADQFALQESHFLWLSTGDVGAMKAGIAPYENGSEASGLSRSGWGWDARLADFDNDGVLEAIQATGFVKGTINRWPELQALGTGNDELMENPRNWPGFRAGDDLSGHDSNAFFVRAEDGRFYDIAADIGLNEPMVSRGIAIGDVDGDGNLDFALANQWEPSYFYHNERPSRPNFIGLHLLLPLRRGETRVRAGHPAADTPGRPAVGAQATVSLPDRRLVAQVDGGSGHSGKRSPDLHFGLGSTAERTPIKVVTLWRDPLHVGLAHAAQPTSIKVELRWRDPSGRPHTEEVHLTPGWHTVVLGWPQSGGH